MLTHPRRHPVEMVGDIELGHCPPGASYSAIERVGAALFLADDEESAIERRPAFPGSGTAARRIDLAPLFGLKGDREMDIEGLAVDDGWLWVLGSHGASRPKWEDGPRDFARIRRRNRRCLLGRVPLAGLAEGEAEPQARVGRRRAERLARPHGSDGLIDAIEEDTLLAPFLALPTKENGLDIEGLAVDGRRLVLGLRGPVVRGLAILLELRWPEAKLRHRTLLDLEGLGVRDLCRSGLDLLILAGPTMDLDGPARIYVLPDHFRGPPPASARPRYLGELPFGDRCDRSEGLCVFAEEAGAVILAVVLDGANESSGRALLVRVPAGARGAAHALDAERP